MSHSSLRRYGFRMTAALVLTTLVLAACYTNPITGRKSLIAFTPSEESQLGVNTFNEMKQQTPASTNSTQNEQTQRVGRRISSVVSLPNAQWEFVVFNDDQTANAFCLPGGKVGIYTGILPITADDNGLATVMGHEVAHAVARHGGERMTQQLLVQLGGATLAYALREKPQQTQQLALTAYGAAAVVGYELPFSRKHELEADRMGLMYMAKAGYDPREAVKFWKRFAASNSGSARPPEFLSTHPIDSRRIAELEKHMPEAMALYQKRNG